ncbi:imidazole glycerol phosphate synthase subunit HisH [Ramlibacter albus]|uniref:Imidazole glycerol phosphate synthase subunit HisH n=1 Tax=Ramlibacter albus TaxID=2079448 RepID=A0A923MG74_9BURK|nr:imidazole glycerol phosphate synthase subunit HisH [Ramlibacter albus]MBC5768392.1 imidazole glycerol phosphate synthase subunit HisH [Ramlibacter albus]
MSAVTVLDYGIGNLLNVLRALEHCGASLKVVDKASPEDVDASRLVLPGVGAFGDGMNELRARGFDDLVRRFAQTGRPFLGICVGMQMMFDASEEMGEHAGLGLMAGRVQPVPPNGADGTPHRVPHIGWRPLEAATEWKGTIMEGVAPGERAYFVHSFAAVPADDGVRLADVHYDGRRICAAVHRDNLYGCQFHPERSAHAGLGMLERFLKL